MTYQGDQKNPSKRILTTLVTIAIGLIAYWAATGGFDQILTGG